MTNNYDICWDESALGALRKIFSYLKKNVSASVAIKFRNCLKTPAGLKAVSFDAIQRLFFRQ